VGIGLGRVGTGLGRVGADVGGLIDEPSLGKGIGYGAGWRQ
jgi:hypothetical protein